MSEPIISPWLFYLVSLSDKLLITAAILLVGGGIALGFITAVYWDDNDKLLPHFGKYLAMWIMALFIFMAIPSEATLYKMVIAQNITYERVGKAVDVGKELHNTIKQDVLDVIRELTRDKEKEKK